MSQFIEHRPCPNCGSSNNLAVYVDNEYCFGCKYIKFYNYHPRRIENIKTTTDKIVSLPYDVVPIIPAVADEWLRKYKLSVSELIKHRVVWSEMRNLLIFPYFGPDNYLFGYQGRYFGNDPKHPKWVGFGGFKRQNSYLVGPDKTKIVIVEDIISAIRLARKTSSSCLFGSFVDYSKYINIYNIYKPKEYIIWLDDDKKKESYLYSYNLNKLGIQSRVISTKLDPKCYSDSEIELILNNI